MHLEVFTAHLLIPQSLRKRDLREKPRNLLFLCCQTWSAVYANTDICRKEFMRIEETTLQGL